MLRVTSPRKRAQRLKTTAVKTEFYVEVHKATLPALLHSDSKGDVFASVEKGGRVVKTSLKAQNTLTDGSSVVDFNETIVLPVTMYRDPSGRYLEKFVKLTLQRNQKSNDSGMKYRIIGSIKVNLAAIMVSPTCSMNISLPLEPVPGAVIHVSIRNEISATKLQCVRKDDVVSVHSSDALEGARTPESYKRRSDFHLTSPESPTDTAIGSTEDGTVEELEQIKELADSTAKENIALIDALKLEKQRFVILEKNTTHLNENLKSESERARTFATKNAELESELSRYVNELDGLKQQLLEKEDLITSLTEDRDTVSCERSRYIDELDGLKQQLLEKEDLITSLTEDRDTVSCERSHYIDELDGLKQQLLEKEDLITSLTEDRDTVSCERSRYIDELDGLKQQLLEKEDMITSLTEDRDTVSCERSHYIDELDGLKQQLLEKEDLITSLTEDRDTVSCERSRYIDELDGLKQQLLEKEDLITSLTEDRDTVSCERSRYIDELDGLKQQLLEKEDLITSLTEDRDTVSCERSHYIDELDGLKQQLLEKEDLITSLTEDRDTVSCERSHYIDELDGLKQQLLEKEDLITSLTEDRDTVSCERSRYIDELDGLKQQLLEKEDLITSLTEDRDTVSCERSHYIDELDGLKQQLLAKEDIITTLEAVVGSSSGNVLSELCNERSARVLAESELFKMNEKINDLESHITTLSTSSARKSRRSINAKFVEAQFLVYEAILNDAINDDGITLYKIVVRALGNIEWVVHRRYTAFRELYEKILQLTSLDIDSPFPQKRRDSWIKPFDASVVSARQKQLKAWLMEVVRLSNESVRPIGANPDDIRSLRVAVGDFLESSAHTSDAQLY